MLTTHDNSSLFKKLRINFISKAQPTTTEAKHFHADHTEKIKAERYLTNIQSPFSDMETSTYRVLIKVSKEVARYFKSKPYLKSQQIVETSKDGSLLVTYEITNDMEIIPIIQR